MATNSFFASSLDIAAPAFDATTSKTSTGKISSFFAFATVAGGSTIHFAASSADADAQIAKTKMRAVRFIFLCPTFKMSHSARRAELALAPGWALFSYDARHAGHAIFGRLSVDQQV